MNKYIFYSWLIFSQSSVCAQMSNAKIIDTSAFGHWPAVGSPSITADGKYVLYTLYNSTSKGRALVVRSIAGNWEKQIDGVAEGVFSNNSKFLICESRTDTMMIMTLGKDNYRMIPNVSFFKVATGNQNYVLYKNSGSNKIVLCNLDNNTEKNFDSVVTASFSDNGNCMLMTRLTKNSSKEILDCLSLINSRTSRIWEGEKCQSVVFDSDCKKLAFIEAKGIKEPEYAIWYYKMGDSIAERIVDNKAIDSDLSVSNSSLRFSKDGSRIFFSLKQRVLNKKERYPVKLNVWSYNDVVIQPQQLKDIQRTSIFAAVINVQNRKIIRLENENERIIGNSSEFNGDHILIDHQKGYESWWNLASRATVYLVSLNDGSRISIKSELTYSPAYYFNFPFSPMGTYFIWFDPTLKKYFTYNTEKKKAINISTTVPVPLVSMDYNEKKNMPVGILGWLDDGRTILVYDDYDIWALDAEGVKTPVNITNSIGRKHHLKFRFIGTQDNSNASTFHSGEKLLLTVFNQENKFTGFYNVVIGEKTGPELLTMGPFNYCHLSSQSPEFSRTPYPFTPIKAKTADVWVVRRMSFNEAPNYFVTRDFKNYEAITNIQPQSQYNWFTAELIQWKTFDGGLSTGILYKPKDFNSSKKYPILFNYYEKLSDGLYDYIEPAASTDNINIPYFVNRDYLIFVPDIDYSTRGNGISAFNSVVSAAKYFSRIPWVNSEKMGIQGHSHGGYETNYIITHSTLFAAAAEASGSSDLISSYGQLNGDASPRQYGGEIGFQGKGFGIGVTPWTNTKAYVSNSAIFNISNVTTPLLMMHGRKDGAVPFAQAIELYLALRRASKKVWLLEYEDADHQLHGRDAMDYTIRLEQFFNHYLKSAPSPMWMTRGIQASKKGFEAGFELDTSIREPETGLGVNKMSNEEAKF